jgi:dipeptidyl-peptidase 4
MAVERLPAAAYERAETMLDHNRSRLALRARVTPKWIDDGSSFWYRVDTERGTQFVLVEPDKGLRRLAFDHERLARSLAAAVDGSNSSDQGRDEGGEPWDPPFHAIEVSRDGVAFDAFGAHWTCRTSDYTCVRDDTHRPRDPLEVLSPDGALAAFVRDHDLWLRSTVDGEEHALTSDGTADRGYATNSERAPSRVRLRRLGLAGPRPVLSWSPDSRRILTHRTDQRDVPPMYLVESTPPGRGRPQTHRYHYAVAGDVRPVGEFLIVDVPSRTVVPAATEPFVFPYHSPITSNRAWWSADAMTAYHLDQSRDGHTLRLLAIDAATGEVATLIEETGATRVEATQETLGRPMVHVLAGGRAALWYSQRDGRGHLYLYDLETGRMVRQVTAGAFAVREILHVDEAGRVAYLSVSGLVAADPYRRSLVSVGLDGGGLTRLTDDDLDHAVSAPGHGRWFVDSASTVDTPPVTTVRGRDGAVLVELERADVARLVAAGWSPPERVRTTAADGETPIYGVLYKPPGFDPHRRYPVVDHTYPGPQTCRVRPSFEQGAWGCDAEAVAALGFVVLAIDGRGTPGRDKAFHDHSYRNMGSAGALEDHVAALRELAGTRPWLDLERVGVFGRSGGGFATVRAMTMFPEVYKVGVAEAGNHDNRYYNATWTETFDGPYDPAAGARLSNTELADRLTGRLLLIHGEMDDNVPAALTLRLVDRLIAANKDFDLLIVPGAEHMFLGCDHYVIRRRWDYLVRHLLRREPPTYRLAEIPLGPDPLELLGD